MRDRRNWERRSCRSGQSSIATAGGKHIAARSAQLRDSRITGRKSDMALRCCRGAAHSGQRSRPKEPEGGQRRGHQRTPNGEQRSRSSGHRSGHTQCTMAMRGCCIRCASRQ